MDFSLLLNIFPISRLQALCRNKNGLYELLSSAGENRKSIILSLADPTGFALAGFARKKAKLVRFGHILPESNRDITVNKYQGKYLQIAMSLDFLKVHI